MKILPIIGACLLLSINLRAQDAYDDIAATFELDSITITAVYSGNLNPADFIRITMEDTTLYRSFLLLKVMPYKMLMENTLYDKKNKVQAWSEEEIHQLIQDKCRWQIRQYDSIRGNFYNKKGEPLSETIEMFQRIFTIDRRTCDLKPGKVPTGMIVLNKPRDVRQQKELIKRLVFAPHTVSVDVPFFGNKMKTDIFNSPTADFYKFSVTTGWYMNLEPVYIFDISIDTAKFPKTGKEVLIKSMRTTFRTYDLQIMQRSYELYYPGSFASCDVSMDIQLIDIENYILPKKIEYSGRWKFPTKGTDVADVTIDFYDIQTAECTH